MRWKVEPETTAVEIQVPAALCKVIPGKAANRNDDVEQEAWVINDPPPTKTQRGSFAGVPMLRLGNSHKLLKAASATEASKHSWVLYVRGEDEEGKTGLKKIEKVVFQLHEDFDPAIVEVCSAPFQVERVGWGVFDAKVEIHLTDGKNVWCQHQLSLDGDGGSSLIPLGLDWSLQHRTQTPPATP